MTKGSEPLLAARNPISGALRLDALLRGLAPLAIAFSGGLDSRFLAHTAARAGLRILLLHITGPHVPREESRAALAWAAERRMPLALLPVTPLSVPAIAAGDPSRCYHCKLFLFTGLKKALAEMPDEKFFTLCDGTNASDLGMHRPGLQALKELKIRSPLAEAGFSKDMIRMEGARTHLDNPDQTARPCLLTRLPYHMPPNEQALAALDAAEEAITALLSQSRLSPKAAPAGGPSPEIADFRLRLRNPTGPPFQAELHLNADPPQKLKEHLARQIMRQGFLSPVIRVMDEVSGYHDRSSSS